MGYILCGHGGSGDHGQEDRIRGTCRLLPSRPTLLTPCIEEDWHYGLAEVADLTCQNLQTGPDNLYLTAAPRQTPGTSVLWCWQGQSLPPRRIHAFSAITVPNPMLLRQLHDQGIGGRLRLGPDPAFLVRRRLRPLDGAFRQDTVGLCLSPCVTAYECRPGLLFESYCRLMCHILTCTTMDIALIPYCAKRNRGDGGLLQALYRRFSDCARVFLRPDSDSPALRGDLSLCRVVVGCSGAIAAWTCGVPALCIGADPYAMGMAQQLFGNWQKTLVPAAWLTDSGALTRHFSDMMKQEDALRSSLERSLPHQRHRAACWDWEKLRLMA